MASQKLFSLLLAVSFLLYSCSQVEGCKSKASSKDQQGQKKNSIGTGSATNAGSTPQKITGKQEDDESPDETDEDIAKDEEDFDLICDDHVPPNRTQRLPDVIIIGAKKGGTRALIEFIKLHPSIKSAGPEVHFFDHHWDKGVDWYISRMPRVTADQLSMEKTPGYFHTPEAARRLFQTVKSAKLLLILRDPVKRLLSDYNQFRSKNLREGNDYPDFEELVLTQDGSVDVNYPPVQRSIYHNHLKRWYDQFPKEQIHIVHGDVFIKEPWTELQKVEEFLQVEPSITQDNFYFNATKGFYCSKDLRVKGVWECTKKKCLSKSKGRPKPKVSDQVITKLKDFFTEHNNIFNTIVGQDFGWNN